MSSSVPAGILKPENGKTIIESLEHVQKQIASANEWIEHLKSDIRSGNAYREVVRTHIDAVSEQFIKIGGTLKEVKGSYYLTNNV